MAEDKKGFILYADLIHTVKKLKKEDAGELFIHILEYVNDLNPNTENYIVDITFEPIKHQLKRDLEKYEKRAERSKINGALGGRPKKEETQKTQQVISEPKKPDTDNVTVTDTVNVTDNVNVKVIKNIIDRKTDFKKILHPFITNYSKELLIEFFEYWSEHGVNDKKMRFEKQTSFDVVRRLKTWEKNNNKFKGNGNTIRTNRLTVDEQLAERNRIFEKNFNDSITANMDRSKDDGFESGQFTNFDAV